MQTVESITKMINTTLNRYKFNLILLYLYRGVLTEDGEEVKVYCLEGDFFLFIGTT